MASGKTIKRMDTAVIITLMEHAMKETGMKINSMVTEKKSGQTMHVMREIIKMGKSTDVVSSFGLMDQHTQAIFLKTIYTETEFTHGLMVESTMEHGVTIKCTDMEYLHGQTGVDIKECIMTIKKKVEVYSHGLTIVAMMGCGKMESNTG